MPGNALRRENKQEAEIVPLSPNGQHELYPRRGPLPFDPRQISALYLKHLIQVWCEAWCQVARVTPEKALEEYAEMLGEALGLRWIDADLLQHCVEGEVGFPASWGAAARWLAGDLAGQIRYDTPRPAPDRSAPAPLATEGD